MLDWACVHFENDKSYLDTGLASIWVVWDDDTWVARGLGNLAPIADLHLNGATGSTFGHFSDWKNVANVKGGLVTTVDGLTGWGTLSGDEGLGVLAEQLNTF